jgi:hypothetical protein
MAGRARRWTPERVVTELRAGAAAKRAISTQPALYGAARRHFGSMAAAAKAAGVHFGPPRGPTEQDVLRALRGIAARHGTVTSALVDEAGLRWAVTRHFGGLTAACSAAGVPGYRQQMTRDREMRYGRDAAVAALRLAAAAARRPVRSRDLSWSLQQALLRHFGGLRAARMAAGLPQPARPRLWSLDRLLPELRREYERGTRLTHGDLIAAGRHDLVRAVSVLRLSLPRARELAGVPPLVRARSPRTPFEAIWDADRVVEETRALADSGRSLASSKAPKRLVLAGIRYLAWISTRENPPKSKEASA